MKQKFIPIIIVIFIIIFIFIVTFFYFNNEHLQKNMVNKNDTENIVCDSNQCPIPVSQNSIYQLHIKYKQFRDINHHLSQSTTTGNIFYKTKGPANIFIIRHGEKIKTKFSLDCNGILRSTHIPSLITDLNNKGFGIHAIVTAYDYISMHKEQTVMLSSWLLNIPLFMYGEATNTKAAVKEVFKNSYFSGKTILFCWEHQCIQSLLKDIIEIGPKTKGIKDYVFKNPIGTSELPYWTTNNYQSIYYFDENLNFSISKENFTTCDTMDNDLILYGKKNKCS